MKILAIFVSLLAYIGVGAACARDDALVVELGKKYEQMLSVYYNGSISEATRALADYLVELNEAEKQAPKLLGYGKIRASVWLRMYSVYKYQGNNIAADKILAKCVDFYYGGSVKNGYSRVDAESEIQKFAEKLDTRIVPKWRTKPMASPMPSVSGR